MNLAIVGSRSYTNEKRVRVLLQRYVERFGANLTVVSGGCPDGGDFLAKKVALDMGLEYKEFPPIHAKYNCYCVQPAENYGKPYNVSNFFVRNTQIAEFCDHAVGFVVEGVKANGTLDTINKATKLGKTTLVFEDKKLDSN
jgi:hypothetical protein